MEHIFTLWLAHLKSIPPLLEVHTQTDRPTKCSTTHSALFCSLRCRGRSGLFIAARMQSHSHSAERLLLFKAHNNRTKTLKKGSLGLCTQSSTDYQSAFFLVVYLRDNDAALSYTSWCLGCEVWTFSFKTAILIVTKSVFIKVQIYFHHMPISVVFYKLLQDLVHKMSVNHKYSLQAQTDVLQLLI